MNIHLKNLITVGFFLFSISVMAQSNQQSSQQADERKFLGYFLSAIFNEISIDQNVYEMKMDGVTQRAFSVGFTVDGQIATISDYDNNYADEIIKIIPYKISFNSEGRTYIDIAPVKYEIGEIDEDKYTVGISGLSFEYRKNYDYGQQTDFFLGIIKGTIDGKIPLGGDFFLKGNADLSLGAVLDLKVEGKDAIDLGAGTGLNFNYGISLDKTFKKNNTISIGISGGNKMYKVRGYWAPGLRQRQIDIQNSSDIAITNRTAAQNQWDTDKFQWEVDNGYGESTSSSHYMAASGAGSRPNDLTPQGGSRKDFTQSVLRRSFFLAPSLGYTKKFKNGNSLGLRASVNLFLFDRLKGVRTGTFDAGDRSGYVADNEFVRMNLINNYRSLNIYQFKLIYKFGSKKR